MKILLKRKLITVSLVLCVLAIPFTAMQFTQEVKWSLLDFVIAATLLSAFAFFIEYILRKTIPTKNKIAFIIIATLLLIIVWLELAVGIFNTPLSGS